MRERERKASPKVTLKTRHRRVSLVLALCSPGPSGGQRYRQLVPVMKQLFKVTPWQGLVHLIRWHVCTPGGNSSSRTCTHRGKHSKDKVKIIPPPYFNDTSPLSKAPEKEARNDFASCLELPDICKLQLPDHRRKGRTGPFH